MSTRRIQSIFTLLVYNPKQCCKIAMKLDEKMSWSIAKYESYRIHTEIHDHQVQKVCPRKSPLNTFQAQKKRVEPNFVSFVVQAKNLS